MLKEITLDSALEDVNWFVDEKLKIIKNSLEHFELGIYERQTMKFKREYILNYIKEYILDFEASKEVKIKVEELDIKYQKIDKENSISLENWLDKQENLLNQFAEEEFISEYTYIENLTQEKLYSEYFEEKIEDLVILDDLYYNKETEKLIKLEIVE